MTTRPNTTSHLGAMTLAAILCSAFCLSAADRQPAPRTNIAPSAIERAIAEVQRKFDGDAGGASDIQIFTRTNTNISPGYVTMYEEFTRDGQTNLLRITVTKDGMVRDRAHSFYYQGAYLGRYTWAGDITIMNSAAGAPYSLNFVLNSSNQPVAASVMATNYVILDSFTCTNGIFSPEESSRIRESNRKIKEALPPH